MFGLAYVVSKHTIGKMSKKNNTERITIANKLRDYEGKIVNTKSKLIR